MNDQTQNKSNSYWKTKLTPEQYRVCRLKGTDSPFIGKYYHHNQKGIYRCVACGQLLFLSDAKYDSGSGWPSFSTPLSKNKIFLKEDKSLSMKRTEVLCAGCSSHLGHVFDDDTVLSGTRYCINSTALDFNKT
ncbi:MAG TPA: peptide-methionine (R)-S-oxide reductase MsrB [Patescibacteria group bacterium]|nr:peptide-methionine (R)-S-oxide reductase MsrB [Patescibacteria group bacterium]